MRPPGKNLMQNSPGNHVGKFVSTKRYFTGKFIFGTLHLRPTWVIFNAPVLQCEKPEMFGN